MVRGRVVGALLQLLVEGERTKRLERSCDRGNWVRSEGRPSKRAGRKRCDTYRPVRAREAHEDSGGQRGCPSRRRTWACKGSGEARQPEKDKKSATGDLRIDRGASEARPSIPKVVGRPKTIGAIAGRAHARRSESEGRPEKERDVQGTREERETFEGSVEKGNDAAGSDSESPARARRSAPVLSRVCVLFSASFRPFSASAARISRFLRGSKEPCQRHPRAFCASLPLAFLRPSGR
jgi:hypothetical protein